MSARPLRAALHQYCMVERRHIFFLKPVLRKYLMNCRPGGAICEKGVFRRFLFHHGRREYRLVQMSADIFGKTFQSAGWKTDRASFNVQRFPQKPCGNAGARRFEATHVPMETAIATQPVFQS